MRNSIQLCTIYCYPLQFLEDFTALKPGKLSRFEHDKGRVVRDMIAHKYGDEQPISSALVAEADRWDVGGGAPAPLLIIASSRRG